MSLMFQDTGSPGVPIVIDVTLGKDDNEAKFGQIFLAGFFDDSESPTTNPIDNIEDKGSVNPTTLDGEAFVSIMTMFGFPPQFIVELKGNIIQSYFFDVTVPGEDSLKTSEATVFAYSSSFDTTTWRWNVNLAEDYVSWQTGSGNIDVTFR